MELLPKGKQNPSAVRRGSRRSTDEDKRNRIVVGEKNSALRTNWLQSFGLLSKDEVPVYCHEPYISHGYRQNPSSIRYCINSALHPTNETLNMWTHGLPCFFLLWFNISFAIENFGDLSWADNLFFPYWFFVFGTTATLFGSACAHMFNCISPGVREACFCCDYGFIALQALGVTCCFTFYVCPYNCMGYDKGAWLLPYVTALFGNVVTVASACYTRYPGVPYRHVMRLLPFVLMFTLVNAPCMNKYATIHNAIVSNNTTVKEAISICNVAKSSVASGDFNKLCIAMVVGATIKALKFPERLKPGMFDVVGHSHQIFHLFTALGIYYQSVLIQGSLREVIVLNRLGHLGEEQLNITHTTGLHLPLICNTLSLAVALYYSYDLHRKCTMLPTYAKGQ